MEGFCEPAVEISSITCNVIYSKYIFVQVTLIQEAVKYIEELHNAVIQRFGTSTLVTGES